VQEINDDGASSKGDSDDSGEKEWILGVAN
jgi:hypothetical protein